RPCGGRGRIAFGGRPDHIEVALDPNIYKNGLAVSIPGTNGMCGLDTAAAIGAVGGDPRLRLEVLDPVDQGAVQKAQELLADGNVDVHLLEDRQGLYIHTTVTSGPDRAECIIQGSHDNIVALRLNGRELAAHPLVMVENKAQGHTRQDLEAWLKTLSLKDLLAMVDDLDADDFAFLQEGVDQNMRLAAYGLKYGTGLNVGMTLERLVRQRLLCKDMAMAARILASAAADARMAGIKLPAMSSAGSGNHGLTAILPIRAVKDYVECPDKVFLEAIALSHMLTAYIKTHTGRLSAVCGCSIAAGAGATAGITYLLGGHLKHIAGAITNLTEDLAGVICDGAKAGCSLKLATAAGAAVQAALFALQGVNVLATDGIIGHSPEQTMQNIGTLSTQGMVETDRTILKIMLEKKFQDV
ncbi:MAG: L-serine ammonia-lyase, iron-sulfur-dependent, subunit alpha, partial [Desulfobacterales bacterium]